MNSAARDGVQKKDTWMILVARSSLLHCSMLENCWDNLHETTFRHGFPLRSTSTPFYTAQQSYRILQSLCSALMLQALLSFSLPGTLIWEQAWERERVLQPFPCRPCCWIEVWTEDDTLPIRGQISISICMLGTVTTNSWRGQESIESVASAVVWEEGYLTHKSCTIYGAWYM